MFNSATIMIFFSHVYPLNLPLQESPRKHQAAKAQEETQVSAGKSLPPETLTLAKA